MRDDWPAWAQQAWTSLTPAQRERAREVFTALAEVFEGVLVGPGPLVRHLVEAERLGHRSTLETLALLVQQRLVHVRHAAEGPILWIPADLMPEVQTPGSPKRPTFLTTPRSNGARERSLAQA